MKLIGAGEKQLAYNEANGIIPQQIKKALKMSVFASGDGQQTTVPKAYVEPTGINVAADPIIQYMNRSQLEKNIEKTKKQMRDAAKKLEFLEAAQYRDELIKLEDLLKEKFPV